MIRSFERTDRKLIDSNHVFDYCKDTLKLPDGRTVEYATLLHKGAAGIVPVLDDGRILLVKQYRHAIGRVSLEIPAGGRDSSDEEFITAAARELEEETGYRSNDLEHLISIVTAIAYCDEKIEVYVAKHLILSKQKLDPDEFIEVVPCELSEIMGMIYRSEIQDSKTIAAVMSYYAKFVAENDRDEDLNDN